MVVEDNKADVYLIRKAIENADIKAHVHIVYDGHAATQFFDAADLDEKAPRPHLVLLDLNLPKKTGEDVLVHLRKSLRCRDALVLIVTSSNSARDRNAVAALSIAGYFRKSSEFSEFMKLGQIVKSLLE